MRAELPFVGAYILERDVLTAVNQIVVTAVNQTVSQNCEVKMIGFIHFHISVRIK